MNKPSPNVKAEYVITRMVAALNANDIGAEMLHVDKACFDLGLISVCEGCGMAKVHFYADVTHFAAWETFNALSSISGWEVSEVPLYFCDNGVDPKILKGDAALKAYALDLLEGAGLPLENASPSSH